MAPRTRQAIIAAVSLGLLAVAGLGVTSVRQGRIPAPAEDAGTAVARLSALRPATALPTRRELAAALVGPTLARMEAAMEERDVEAAVDAWHEAYAAAIIAGDWRSAIAVGDAALRLGAERPGRRGVEARARRAYLAGLVRAQRAGSAEGVLRAADGLAAAGDAATANDVRGWATRLASRPAPR